MKRQGRLWLYVFLILPVLSIGQTVHLGLNYSINSTYLLNKSMSFTADDTSYVYTGGRGGGFSGSFYFDDGGMYHQRLYGIRIESNFIRHGQVLKIFPGKGPADPDSFYSYKTSLQFTDIPLLFVLCPSHHQGFTLELGPQISFLRGGMVNLKETTVRDPAKVLVPQFNQANYRKITYSIVFGLGLFYNVTERLAFTASFRSGIGFSDTRQRQPTDFQYFPTRRFWWGLNLQGVYKFNRYYARKNRGSDYYLRKMRKK
jgi:hypothetical protein